MKTIETSISEQRFLSRIENTCRKKTRFDDGYKSLEVFVVKQNENKFWLVKHYPAAPKSREYTGNCLYCKYFKNQDGHIVVNYSFGKRIMHLILTLIIVAVSLVLWGSVIYDIITKQNVDIVDVLITAAICLVGVALSFRHSKKERKELEDHLLKICNVEI